MGFGKFVRSMNKVNRVVGDVRAAKEGRLGKRLAKRAGHRALSKVMQKLFK